jgi:NAD(P)-dependent dehydrogenase (short-subunit alcohol dehydrogenase family)
MWLARIVLQEVVHVVAQHGVKTYAPLADVSKETQVKDVFSTFVVRLGTIDIPVDTAGLQRDARFGDNARAMAQRDFSKFDGSIPLRACRDRRIPPPGYTPKYRPAPARSFA